MHYYQFNIADYRKDTQHLSPIEHYIYRWLIDWYYLDEKPIPKKTELVMRRLCLVSENAQQLENVLQEFFVETENGWCHGRIDKEIAKYHAKADTARINGSKGGRPKKPKKTQSVILANPEKTGLKANQEPITNNHKPISNRAVAQRFAPPTVDEVADYVRNKGLPVDPVRFVDFYESKGWMVGRNKMKSWEAAVRTWSKRDDAKGQTSRHSSLRDDLTDTSWAN